MDIDDIGIRWSIYDGGKSFRRLLKSEGKIRWLGRRDGCL